MQRHQEVGRGLVENANALIVGPPWHQSGSYRTFKDAGAGPAIDLCLMNWNGLNRLHCKSQQTANT